jgi:hypothetical protein
VPGATTPGYPLAKPAPAPAVAIQDGCVVYAQATPRELTPAEQEGVQTLYDELKPQATDAARNFVLARTKAEWQEAMSALIDADWPLPEPPVV